MQGESRRKRAAGSYVDLVTGALLRACPVCNAPVGYKCRRVAYDDNRQPYVVRDLKALHAARKT
jgi:hypothetical protein